MHALVGFYKRHWLLIAIFWILFFVDLFTGGWIGLIVQVPGLIIAIYLMYRAWVERYPVDES